MTHAPFGRSQQLLRLLFQGTLFTGGPHATLVKTCVGWQHWLVFGTPVRWLNFVYCLAMAEVLQCLLLAGFVLLLAGAAVALQTPSLWQALQLLCKRLASNGRCSYIARARVHLWPQAY